MKRIAAPMIGGVITSGILELLLYPVIYVFWRKRHLGTALARPVGCRQRLRQLLQLSSLRSACPQSRSLLMLLPPNLRCPPARNQLGIPVRVGCGSLSWCFSSLLLVQGDSSRGRSLAASARAGRPPALR